MGRPNAPMVELINGLQSLTQGGLSFMTPQQLEKSVRDTYSIAKYTGLGLEGMMGFAGTASQILDRIGLPRELAPQIAQSSALYAFAYGQTARPLAFGGLDKEQASQADIILRANAAKSQLAVNYAAFTRFSDELVRQGPWWITAKTGFIPGSEAEAIAQAIKAGSETYTFNGKEQRLPTQATQTIEILKRGGVSGEDAAQAVFSPAGSITVADQIEKYRIQDLVRERQGDVDLPRLYGSSLTGSLLSSLKGANLTPAQRRALGRGEIGTAFIEEASALLESQPNLFDRGREAERNQAIAARIQKRFAGQLGGVSLADLSNATGRAISDANIVNVLNPKARGYRSFVNALQLNRRNIARTSARTRKAVQALSDLQKTFSGVGVEGVLARAADYLRDVGPDGGKTKEAIARILGGIPIKQISEPLQKFVEGGGAAGAIDTIKLLWPALSAIVEATKQAQPATPAVQSAPSALPAGAQQSKAKSDTKEERIVTGILTIEGLDRAILQMRTEDGSPTNLRGV
jgi:hypothetical protein